MVVGPSRAKSLKIENSALESLKASLKEETISESEGLLAESQKEFLKMLKHESEANVRKENEVILENEPRSFYTPINSVRIGNVENNDPKPSLNTPIDCKIEKPLEYDFQTVLHSIARRSRKHLNKIFRLFYMALHAFSRNNDMMSSKSRKRDQKIKNKMSANFLFCQFWFVATLSHWFQSWVKVDVACFQAL